MKAEERFWTFVRRGRSDECWPWIGRTHEGYGELCLYFENKCMYVRAHRFALSLVSHPTFSWVFACHTCDNSLCCNPSHLYWGDVITNNQDRVSRGRSARVSQPGVANKARELHSHGLSMRAISRMLGVTPHAVRLAVNNKNPRKWIRKTPPAPPLAGA